MAYRTDLTSTDDPALHRARIELWLVDALVARRHRRHPVLVAEAAVFVAAVGLLGVADHIDSPSMGGLGLVVILGVLIAAWWGDRDARALARRAVERGLPRGVVQHWMVATDDADERLDRWHAEATTRVQWFGWRAGLPTTMGQCVTLAHRLRELPRLDPEQLDFLRRMDDLARSGEIGVAEG